MQSGVAKAILDAEPECAVACPTEFGRVREHGLEYGLQVAPRSSNDLQHFGRRGLLLQGFSEIIGALAQLVKQSRVLDGDDSLRGEVLDQLDLFLGEWPHLGAVDEESADQLVRFEHRNRNARSRTAISDRRTLLLFGRPVHNMDYLFCLTNAAKQLAGLRSKSALLYEKLRISGRDIKHCCWVNHCARPNSSICFFTTEKHFMIWLSFSLVIRPTSDDDVPPAFRRRCLFARAG